MEGTASPGGGAMARIGRLDADGDDEAAWHVWLGRQG